MFKKKQALLGILAFSCANITFAAENMQSFDCQVVTASGTQGLVTYTTTSKKAAESGVLGLDADTVSGPREKAVSVVKCIQRSKGEKFWDSGFQSWADNIER